MTNHDLLWSFEIVLIFSIAKDGMSCKFMMEWVIQLLWWTASDFIADGDMQCFDIHQDISWLHMVCNDMNLPFQGDNMLF